MALSIQEIADALPSVRDVRLSTPAALSHSVIIPYATYSPWYDDTEFAAIFKEIRGNTLVDIYRLFELWSLAGQACRMGGDIIEIGVWRGGSGCLMAARATALGSGATIFLCDTFSGVVRAGEKDSHYRGGEHADTSVALVTDLAARLGLDNVRILQGIFPDDTGGGIADRRFALCHIDVDVYESARHILDWVWPRLKVGGIVVFDDYGFPTCEGIARLVNEQAPRTDAVMIHNLNGHAILIKQADGPDASAG